MPKVHIAPPVRTALEYVDTLLHREIPEASVRRRVADLMDGYAAVEREACATDTDRLAALAEAMGDKSGWRALMSASASIRDRQL